MIDLREINLRLMYGPRNSAGDFGPYLGGPRRSALYLWPVNKRTLVVPGIAVAALIVVLMLAYSALAPVFPNPTGPHTHSHPVIVL